MILDNPEPKMGKFAQKLKQISKFMYNKHATSGIVQFQILFKLMMLKAFRNRTIFLIQLIHYVICGVFIGLIFLHSGNDGHRMFDHLKYCLGVVFFAVYTQMMVPILSCKLMP